MDKDSLVYLKAELDKDIAEKRNKLEEELQENLKSINPMGHTVEERAEALKNHEKQKRLEQEAKMREYTKVLESKRFEDFGGSYENANRQMELESQSRRNEEIQKQQDAHFKQAQDHRDRANHDQSIRYDLEKKKKEQANKEKQSQLIKDQEHSKEMAKKAERDRLRKQFNREGERGRER